MARYCCPCLRWRPKLLVTVSMHAPKVALADEGGSTTLVADLGHFTLTTDNQQADSLTEDERAVYDCFQLRWGPHTLVAGAAGPASTYQC